MRCSSCGHETADAVKFCPECGAPAAPTAPARETRKIVTIVFSDLAGSTAMGERLDPEALRGLMARYFDAMQACVETHGGLVEKFIGDAVMAVFGVPVTNEDDALRAVRAAAAMRDVQAELNEDFERAHGIRLAVRTGVNTGEVVTAESPDRQRIVTGDAVNVAARLEQAAAPGDILLGAETWRLVRSKVEAEELAEPLELKGKSEPMPAYRLLSFREEAPPVTAGDPGTSFVGRERERSEIEEAYASAVADRTAALATLLGSAGVGKSRLVAETLAGLDPAPAVLAGRCLSYGDAITFWPVLEIVKAAAGVTDEDSPEAVRNKVSAIFAGGGPSVDAAAGPAAGQGAVEGTGQGQIAADRLLSLMGLAPATSAIEDIQWAFARFVEQVGRGSPAVIVVDDLHWAEPALLDLIERVAIWRLTVPVLVLCIARPELLEERPSWATDVPEAVTVELEPLGEGEGRELVDALLGATDMDDPTTERIVHASGGNPLFVEELLATLTEDGYLKRDADGTWHIARSLADFEIPASVTTLLAARLERLERGELGVLEGGAVIGQVFERAAAAMLAPEELRPDVATYLGALVSKDLLRREGGTSADEVFWFRHILLRDTAYASMAKATRAELHERFAGWLEAAAAGRLAEYREILVHHLEQAHIYRKELGAPEEECAELALRASEHSIQAAWKALGIGDRAGAADLFARTADLLPPGDPERIRALAEHASVCWWTGDHEGRNRSRLAAAEGARALGDPAWIAYTAFLEQLLDDMPYDAESFRDKAEAAIESLDGRDDLLPELTRCFVELALDEYSRGCYAAAARAWERAVGSGRSVERFTPVLMENGAILAMRLTLDATPVGDALATLRDTLLPDARGSQLALAHLHSVEGILLGMQGEFEQARRVILACMETLPEDGSRFESAQALMSLSMVSIWEGKLDEATRTALQAWEVWAGTDMEMPFFDIFFAEIQFRLGNLVEAERSALRVRDARQEAFPFLEARWRCVLAVVEADRGERDKALRLIEEANRLLEGTEEFFTTADSFMSRAEVMERLGEYGAAREAAQRALDMYTRKGIVPEIRRSQDFLERTAGLA